MLYNLANMCSHLQNASKARLAITSLPNTKCNLALCIALQHAGFLSTVVRGGTQPPPLLSPTDQPHASVPELAGEAIVTQENVASRRIWVGLKYWNQAPVLQKMSMVSLPKKRVTLKVHELNRVVRGTQSHPVQGLKHIGECLFLATDKGIMEARQCLDRETGGLVLCRVH